VVFVCVVGKSGMGNAPKQTNRIVLLWMLVDAHGKLCHDV